MTWPGRSFFSIFSQLFQSLFDSWQHLLSYRFFGGMLCFMWDTQEILSPPNSFMDA